MDLSHQYESLMKLDQDVLSRGDIEKLKGNYQFLFVKGIFGDSLPNFLDNYFSDHIEFLKRNQIDCLRVESDGGFGTQKLSTNNVEPLESAIKQLNGIDSNKKVIIISHSKGGLDTLEMLVTEGSEVKSKLAGWISLNVPFSGTPLANWAMGNVLIRWAVNNLIDKLFKGDKETIHSLRTDVCQQNLIEHSGAIARLCRSIGILNFTSHITMWDKSIFSAQNILLNTLSRLENDGVVPQKSGLLTVNKKSCCPYIHAKHVDHIATVLSLKPEAKTSKARREKKFTVFLKLWLENYDS